LFDEIAELETTLDLLDAELDRALEATLDLLDEVVGVFDLYIVEYLIVGCRIDTSHAHFNESCDAAYSAFACRSYD
jgi:hypothetical protein